MARHAWIAAAALVSLILVTLLSSSLIVGAPAEQVTPTLPVGIEQLFQTSTAPTPTSEQSAGSIVLDMDALQQSRQQDGGFVVGDPNAPVTLVEFGDFACPHCQEYQSVMTQFLMNDVLTGKAKFEYRIFPTAGGQMTYYAGLLLECAEDQRIGNFWKGYTLMQSYALNGQYDQSMDHLLAKDENLDDNKLLNCAQNATQVQTDINLGQQVGVTGTPAVLIRKGNGAPQFITYEGQTYNEGGVPYEVIEAVVDAAQSS